MTAHGLDVDEQGDGVVSEPRLYQLIRQHGRVASARSRSRSSTPGVEAYVFTFG